MEFLPKSSIIALMALCLSACSIARPMPDLPRHPATDPVPMSSVMRDEINVRSAAPVRASLDARLSTFSYPFTVRFMRLRTQGESMQMAYMDERSANPNGKTVLLLHGKNFTSAYWQSTIASLVEKGYRVVAPDQIGFGRSTKPSRYQYSFNTLADNTRRLLAVLKIERVHVVGHSMGGMLAVRFALNHPELTEKLVLVNPIGLDDRQKPGSFVRLEDRYSDELRQTPNDLREYMQKNYFGGVWDPSYEEFLEPHIGWMQGPDARLVAWNKALTSDMIYSQPVAQDFPRVEKPTLLLIGQRDRTGSAQYPELARLATAAFPNARLTSLARAGHLPMVDAFDAYIRELTQFLDGN